MNERIKELAEQAFVITTDGKIGHVNAYMVEQFAKLIIKECALQCVHNEDMDLIEKHFGVEE